ncbi:MAG: cysteine desulfurase [Candidatus Omnitrophica bacterium]|nr:cysteine desulfurase [Candidatus Omnitrophota bacterium]
MAIRQQKVTVTSGDCHFFPRRPIYLDNHATTAVDERVVGEMLSCFTEQYGNAASATHVLGRGAAGVVETARARVAGLIGAYPDEILFTSGATESNALALGSLAGRKGHIISVLTEHKSVLDTLKKLELAGNRVTYLPVDPDGKIKLNEMRAAINSQTVLISVMMANNETGVIQPIANIAAIAKEKGVLVHTDATQAVGRVRVDARELGADMISFSAHKMYGPKGIGALWVRRGIAKTPDLVSRPGTLNVPAIAGFGKAAEISFKELPQEITRITALRNRLWQGLREAIPRLELNASMEERLSGNLNISFTGVDAQSLLLALSDEIALSAGSACLSASRTQPSHVLVAMGMTRARALSSIRFGLGRFNTGEEIEYVVDKIAEIVKKLRSLSPSNILFPKFV